MNDEFKMPLGTEVHIGPGHIVLDGVPALPTERNTAAPTFRLTLFWHGRPSQLLLDVNMDHPVNYASIYELVSWSLTSLFSTNMAISETITDI